MPSFGEQDSDGNPRISKLGQVCRVPSLWEGCSPSGWMSAKEAITQGPLPASCKRSTLQVSAMFDLSERFLCLKVVLTS